MKRTPLTAAQRRMVREVIKRAWDSRMDEELATGRDPERAAFFDGWHSAFAEVELELRKVFRRLGR